MVEIHGTTTLVGLLGWPTSHSLSPRMQNAGFGRLGLDWAYVPLPTPSSMLPDAVRGLVAAGFAGANVTIPHKQAVLPLCDELDDVAARAGSVNTVVVVEGRLLGSSTDGAAVTDQIEAHGRRAIVVGTGGASRAVAQALRDVGADVVVLSLDITRLLIGYHLFSVFILPTFFSPSGVSHHKLTTAPATNLCGCEGP
jgi:shikimate dehydrogenase